MIRDLVGTLDQHKGEMGVLILLHDPTRGIKEVADHSGTYEVPMTGATTRESRSLPWQNCWRASARRCPRRSCPTSRQCRSQGRSPSRCSDLGLWAWVRDAHITDSSDLGNLGPSWNRNVPEV